MPTAPDLPAADVRVVLVHSPLTGRDVWLPVAERLRASGCQVLVPRLTDPGHPPFWEAHVTSVVHAIGEPAQAASPLVLVLHSGAGPLADHLTWQMADAGHTIEAVVFADADLPTGGASRLIQLQHTDPAFAADLAAALQEGRRVPDWTDAQLRPLVPDGARRRRLLDGLRTLPEDYWTEPIPRAEPPPHHRAVLRFSDSYERTTATADEHNWPLIDLRAHNHFLPLADEELVAEAVLGLIDVLLALPGDGHPGRVH